MVATDLNPYLLTEAATLAHAEGMGERIRFEQTDAEQLRYRDNEFDIAISCTVMEEGDADRMLTELARVTKPGGRIVIVTRAIDVDWWVNIELPEDLKRKLHAYGPKTGAGVGAKGCADGGIYLRVMHAGVKPVEMGPRFAAYRDGGRLEDVLARLASALSSSEKKAFQRAVSAAKDDGTLLVAEPFHCVVGEVQ